MIYHGGHHDLCGLSDIVQRAKKTLKPYTHLFDSITVMGMSGVTVGVPVGLDLGIPVVIIRKDSDTSHSGKNPINLRSLGSRSIFLDDFITAGMTRRRVQERVERGGARLVGAYLYRDDRWLEMSHPEMSLGVQTAQAMTYPLPPLPRQQYPMSGDKIPF